MFVVYTYHTTMSGTRRINPESIDTNRCQARKLDVPEKFSKQNPTYYASRLWIWASRNEIQCKNNKYNGKNLCKTCKSHVTKFNQLPTNATHGMKTETGWHGFITNEPKSYSHMVGTRWGLHNIGAEPTLYVDEPEYVYIQHKNLIQYPALLTPKFLMGIEESNTHTITIQTPITSPEMEQSRAAYINDVFELSDVLGLSDVC